MDSGELAARLRRLEDRSEIADLMSRYAEGVRLGSAEEMAACFTDDAAIEYGSGAVERGRDQIAAYFAAMLEPAASPLAFDERLASSPLVSNVVVELDGDSAHCGSTVLALHAGARDGRAFVVARGTRNEDELVRTAAGWRIRRRVHTSSWQFEVPAGS
jgi:ketosteroid isomerase-like protein